MSDELVWADLVSRPTTVTSTATDPVTGLRLRLEQHVSGWTVMVSGFLEDVCIYGYPERYLSQDRKEAEALALHIARVLQSRGVWP